MNHEFKYNRAIYGIADGYVVRNPYNMNNYRYGKEDRFPPIKIPSGLLPDGELPVPILFECRGYWQTDKFLEWLDTIDWFKEQMLDNIRDLVNEYREIYNDHETVF
jgi:hypothetical protein